MSYPGYFPVVCKDIPCQTAVYYVVSGLGNLSLLYILLWPIIDIRKLEKQNKLGTFDITPYSLLLLTEFSWMCYGMYIGNWMIAAPNVIGVVSALYCVMATLRLTTEKDRNKQYTILFPSLLLLLLIIMICFIHFKPNDFDTGKRIIGILNIITLLCVNGSPLFNIFHILKTKSSNSIYLPFVTGVFFTALSFATFGFLLNDTFVYVPYLISLVMALTQLALVVVFPKTKHRQETQVFPEDNIKTEKEAFA